MTRVNLTAELGMWLHREFPSCELMPLLLTWPVGMLLSSALLHLESASMSFADVPKREMCIFVILGLFLSVLSSLNVDGKPRLHNINKPFF